MESLNEFLGGKPSQMAKARMVRNLDKPKITPEITGTRPFSNYLLSKDRYAVSKRLYYVRKRLKLSITTNRRVLAEIKRWEKILARQRKKKAPVRMPNRRIRELKARLVALALKVKRWNSEIDLLT